MILTYPAIQPEQIHRVGGRLNVIEIPNYLAAAGIILSPDEITRLTRTLQKPDRPQVIPVWTIGKFLTESRISLPWSEVSKLCRYAFSAMNVSMETDAEDENGYDGSGSGSGSKPDLEPKVARETFADMQFAIDRIHMLKKGEVDITDDDFEMVNEFKSMVNIEVLKYLQDL